MRYVIAFALVLIVSFFAGFVLGAITPENTIEEQIRDDQDQIRYLERWNKRHKRS